MIILKFIANVSLFFAFVSCTASVDQDIPISSPPNIKKENFQTGGVDGGGGKGIVCRYNDGSIQSSELLDLYEGRTVYNLNIIKSNETIDSQIEKALKTFTKEPDLIKAYISLVKKNMVFLPKGSELKDVNDSFDVLFPTGCKAEQLAHYYSDDRILINSDIWEHLSETDKAALILHEAIYKENRTFGATDSRQSRHIVMNLFDSKTQWESPTEGVPNNALKCVSYNGALLMYAFPSGGNNWVFQFEILGQSEVVSKKWTIIPNINNEFDFNEAKTFPVLKGTEKIGTNFKIGTTAISKFEDQDTIIITKRWEPINDKNGQIISGYQTPRYYLSWKSGTYSNLSVFDLLLNCGL